VDLIEKLRAQPGGARLLQVAPAGAFLVGGAVRDLLLDRGPRELDVVVEGDAEALAAALGAGAIGDPNPDRPPAHPEAAVVGHPRFGTAVVELPGGVRIDVAAARRERYPAPGALPEVEPAPLAEDLLRRDFTVNTIAMALDGERPGELREAPHALEDLRARRLRVLHERSFLDDPTRLLRLARYRARLGFAVERGTAQLAAAAVAAGALATVSGARIGAELRLALAEPDPLRTLAELDRLGVTGALHPRLRLETQMARRALELLPGDGRPDLLLLSALALPLALRAAGDPRVEIAALLDRLEFSAADRERVAGAATVVPRLVDELPDAARPSRLRAVALRAPLEGVALAGAVSEPAAEPARRWLDDVRHVRLQVTGDDLLAAGVPAGPAIGSRLEAALRMRLDGELDAGREAELAAALESVHGDAG
jgi:tRNA nucleotidyltransferase (CCA-adding enzyme)